MTRRLDGTISALQADLTGLDSATASELLETWRSDLTGADFEGADDLAGLLAQLQAQLESDDPDATVIAELLGDLSNATQDAADAAPDELAGKLQLLADVLGDMSQEAGG